MKRRRGRPRLSDNSRVKNSIVLKRQAIPLRPEIENQKHGIPFEGKRKRGRPAKVKTAESRQTTRLHINMDEFVTQKCFIKSSIQFPEESSSIASLTESGKPRVEQITKRRPGRPRKIPSSDSSVASDDVASYKLRSFEKTKAQPQTSTELVLEPARSPFSVPMAYQDNAINAVNRGRPPKNQNIDQVKVRPSTPHPSTGFLIEQQPYVSLGNPKLIDTYQEYALWRDSQVQQPTGAYLMKNKLGRPPKQASSLLQSGPNDNQGFKVPLESLHKYPNLTSPSDRGIRKSRGRGRGGLQVSFQHDALIQNAKTFRRGTGRSRTVRGTMMKRRGRPPLTQSLILKQDTFLNNQCAVVKRGAGKPALRGMFGKRRPGRPSKKRETLEEQFTNQERNLSQSHTLVENKDYHVSEQTSNDRESNSRGGESYHKHYDAPVLKTLRISNDTELVEVKLEPDEQIDQN